jgi:hypothetical protein
MNRFTGEAHAVYAPGLWSYARRLLHAFAEAGQPSATGLQLFVGPNGVLVWTEEAQVDRSQPYAGDVFSSPEKPAARIDGQSPATLRPQEPEETLIHAPLEAPVSNEALVIS